MSQFIGEGQTGPADDRPLTDQEYAQVQRLLSDPFSFPLQFKAWLVAYLSVSDLTLPMSAILGLQSLLGITSAGTGTLGIFPAGMIFPYGGGTAPTGSLICDGAAYSRTAQKRLFDAIGTAYGAPDGSTFNVPDLQGRVPVGKGPHPDHDALGDNEGLGASQRRARHDHNVNAVIESKGFSNIGVQSGSDFNVLLDAGADEQGSHAHGIHSGTLTPPIGGPAFVTLNFVIVN